MSDSHRDARLRSIDSQRPDADKALARKHPRAKATETGGSKSDRMRKSEGRTSVVVVDVAGGNLFRRPKANARRNAKDEALVTYVRRPWSSFPSHDIPKEFALCALLLN